MYSFPYVCRYFFYILLIFSLVLVPDKEVKAQKSKTQLEKEKKENLKKLEQANLILREIKKEKKVSISELNVLKQQTKLKERKISTIHDELGILQTDIHNLQSNEQNLARTLANIKKEYAAMVYAASKASITNQLMYLFASETFNQFFMRLQYLRHYSEARRSQASQIEIVSRNLSEQRQKLAEVKQGKEILLTTEVQEKRQLDQLKTVKDKVVGELSLRERELKEKIDRQKIAVRRLERLISEIVSAEIRKSNRSAGTTNSTSREEGSDRRMSLTPEGKMISKSFQGNKNKLVWPVQNGFISTGFGPHEHPVLKRIVVDNLGVDISTRSGEKVRSVFEGTVGLVGQVPGMEGRIVMIRHGEFFTVYSGLKNISVSAGDKVKLKQTIGEVIKDDETGAILQFQIWKNSNRLNPEDWLADD